jgi:hypothetical protein
MRKILKFVGITVPGAEGKEMSMSDAAEYIEGY